MKVENAMIPINYAREIASAIKSDWSVRYICPVELFIRLCQYFNKVQSRNNTNKLIEYKYNIALFCRWVGEYSNKNKTLFSVLDFFVGGTIVHT